MPSSDPSNISEIVKIVSEIHPTNILDVGVGTGKYGLLFRDYLDGHWASHAFHDPKTWTLNLIGIEIHEQYITPVHNYIYSGILVGDAFEILVKSAPQNCFDLVFMGDVIEHFEKDKGIFLIKSIRDNWLCEHGHILISTPNFQTMINNPNSAIFGNQHEIHRCRWYTQEFHDFKMRYKIIEGKLLTVLLSL